MDDRAVKEIHGVIKYFYYVDGVAHLPPKKQVMHVGTPLAFRTRMGY